MFPAKYLWFQIMAKTNFTNKRIKKVFGSVSFFLYLLLFVMWKMTNYRISVLLVNKAL